ncbi:phosphoenolpyruvate--protein phosphotransferase, partial [Myxococcota bacterium]|nr:phosphoenolpyruvate--protein phosphotransferase [Myxococcota bacterium]
KALGGGARLRRGRTEVSAESIVGVMSLDVRCGDSVEIGGEDASMVMALAEAIASGLGELEAGGEDVMESLTAEPSLMRRVQSLSGALPGVVASPGLAVGPAYRFKPQRFDIADQGQGVEWELDKLHRALARSRKSLRALIDKLKAGGSQTRAEILIAHETLLEDTALSAEAERQIHQGRSAAAAWHESTTQQAESLARSDNLLLAARAADLRDVRDRVLRRMFGRRAPIKAIPPGSILIAEDIAPSILSALRPGQILGLATTQGGATSHAAIIARGLGLPALCGLPEALLAVHDGETLILDAQRGVVTISPDEATLEALNTRQEAQQCARVAAFNAREGAAITLDGARIWVEANIGAVEEAEEAVRQGAEGVGLMRSEFLYLNQTHAPSEAEQTAQYRAVAQALGATRPLTVRTLDVGGDKPLPYLPLPHEENPALGLRGIRVGLTRPALLRQQVRAILQGVGAGARLMFPMIARVEELRAARALVEEEAASLGVEGVEIGVMIEIPSAAINAAKLARYADFFSIGTNDLSQYTLAIDRGHPQLAAWADGLDPAVLRLIEMTLEGARQRDRRVGVCGGLASDLEAVPLLIGLGVDHLSASLAAVAEIKALVRSLSRARCRALAARALQAESAEDVRALIRAEPSEVSP